MYHLTISTWKSWKTEFPFALNTEADQIPLKLDELIELRNACEKAISEYQSIKEELPE